MNVVVHRARLSGNLFAAEEMSSSSPRTDIGEMIFRTEGLPGEPPKQVRERARREAERRGFPRVINLTDEVHALAS